jgi:hypothetical protein
VRQALVVTRIPLDNLRQKALAVTTLILLGVAFYQYALPRITSQAHSNQEVKVISRLEAFWPNQTTITSAPASRSGIVWLRPLLQSDLDNSVIGEKTDNTPPQWFVVEMFSSDTKALASFRLHTFVSNPPLSANGYFPLQSGRYVIISSSPSLTNKIVNVISGS